MLVNNELKNIMSSEKFYELKIRLLNQEQAFLAYTKTVQDNLQALKNVSESGKHLTEQNKLFNEYTRLSKEVIQHLQIIVITNMMKSSIGDDKDILKNSAFAALLKNELDKHDYSIDFFPCLVKKENITGIACDVTDEFIENANTTDLLLTILIVAYNHEETIAQCIESVISQVTQYRYKVYILEDCSTDNTLAICKEYAQKYPDCIELIAQPVNTNFKGELDPVYGRGRDRHTNIARKNLLNTPYWYIIEGDDNLIDNKTIQRAISFLEQHQYYVGFCSSFLHYYMQEGRITIDPPLDTAFSEFTADYYSYSHSSTRFYRNIIDWNTYADMENYLDTVMWHEYLMRGKFFFYNTVVSLYRRNNGAWASLSKEKQDEGVAATMHFRKERRKEHAALTDDPSLRPEYKKYFTKKIKN